jgi:predicted transcriptional regulator of viral defense system
MMSPSPELLRLLYPAGYLTDANISDLVGESAGKFNKIRLLVKKGVLTKLRRGFYVVGRDYRKSPLNEFVISNHLYGPSYVSLESALSFYGLIPEAVYEITAINPKRAKEYKTPIGRFSFRKIPESVFSMSLESQNRSGHFIIASAEKALVDKLYLDAPRDISPSYLTDALRVDEIALADLDWKHIVELGPYYSKSFGQALEELNFQLHGD